MNESEYFFDTTRMLNHIDIIMKEKHKAQELYDTLRLMKRVVLRSMDVNSTILYKFQQLDEDIDGLCKYFSSMEFLMDNTTLEANKIIHKIGLMLEENRFDSDKVIDIDVSNI